MDKTITVLVETHVKHKLYGKRMNSSKKFHAHDENNEARVGDNSKDYGNKTIICNKAFPFSRNRKESRNYLIQSERRSLL